MPAGQSPILQEKFKWPLVGDCWWHHVSSDWMAARRRRVPTHLDLKPLCRLAGQAEEDFAGHYCQLPAHRDVEALWDRRRRDLPPATPCTAGLWSPAAGHARRYFDHDLLSMKITLLPFLNKNPLVLLSTDENNPTTITSLLQYNNIKIRGSPTY